MKMRQTKKLLLEKCLTYIEATADNSLSNVSSLLSRSLDSTLQHQEIIKISNRIFLLQTAFQQNRVRSQLAVVSRPEKKIFLAGGIDNSLNRQFLPAKEQSNCHCNYIRIDTNSRTFTIGCCCDENHGGFDHGLLPWDFHSDKRQIHNWKT